MSSNTVVFIISSSRSGSTILDLALGSNENCFSVGELNTFNEEVLNDKWCTCGSRYSACGFLSDVCKCLKHNGIDVADLNQTFRLQQNSRNLLGKVQTLYSIASVIGSIPEWVRNNEIMYEAIFETCGKKIIIDSSKDIVRALQISRRSARYNYKIIHLVRDVRAICHSNKKTSYIIKHPPDYIPHEYASKQIVNVEQTTKEWKNYNNKIMTLMRLFIDENSRLLIRYEDITGGPQTTLNDICTWLGIVYSDKMIHFGNVVHHNVGGNRSRFNSSRIENIAEKWSQMLTDDEIVFCNNNAKRLLNKFHYL